MQEYHNFIKIVGESEKRKKAALEIIGRCDLPRWDLVEFRMNDEAEPGRQWEDSGRSMVDFYSTGSPLEFVTELSSLHKDVSFQCRLLDLSAECFHYFDIIGGEMGEVETEYSVFERDEPDCDQPLVVRNGGITYQVNVDQHGKPYLKRLEDVLKQAQKEADCNEGLYEVGGEEGRSERPNDHE